MIEHFVNELKNQGTTTRDGGAYAILLGSGVLFEVQSRRTECKFFIS